MIIGKRWDISRPDNSLLHSISEECEIPELVCRVLYARGIDSSDRVRAFLNREMELDIPGLIHGMKKASERFFRAVKNDEKVIVFGSNRVDGIVSTALLYSYLSERGCDVSYYIPTGRDAPFLIEKADIAYFCEQGARLIISLDCGLSDATAIEYADCLGIDFVVLDDEHDGFVPPRAVAVVAPCLDTENGMYRDYSSSGIALMFCCALEGDDGIDEIFEEYSDLATLGTIAAAAPLTGVNRLICTEGLRRLNEFCRPGIESLRLIAGLAQNLLTAPLLLNRLSPYLAALGMLGRSATGIELLLGKGVVKTDEFISEIEADDNAVSKLEDEYYKLGTLQLASDPVRLARVIPIVGTGWRRDASLMLARRIRAKTAKPCVVLIRGDVAMMEGVAQDNSGGDLFSLIDGAGVVRKLRKKDGSIFFQLAPNDFEYFYDYLIGTEEYITVDETLKICGELEPYELTLKTAQKLEVLEPYGVGAQLPVFLIRRARISALIPVGNGGQHTRLRMKKDGCVFDAVLFGAYSGTLEYYVGDTVDVAVTLQMRDYGEVSYASVAIRDIRLAGIDCDSLPYEMRLYEKFRRAMIYNTLEALSEIELDALIPTRDEFEILYEFIKVFGNYNGSYEMLWQRCESAGNDIRYVVFRVMLDIFNELYIIKAHKNGETIRIIVNQEKLIFPYPEDSDLLNHLLSTRYKKIITDPVTE